MFSKVLGVSCWALVVLALGSPLSAAIAPTTYQVTLVTTKADDVEAKAAAANASLTAAEQATQNRIDAARAEVAAWVAYSVDKQAVQTALLELSGIASTMYDTHAAEEAPLPGPTPEPDPTPEPEPTPDPGPGDE